MKSLETEAFRLAEQVYVHNLRDDELIRECKSVALQLDLGWRAVWNAVRCAYNNTFDPSLT